jgi:hypothetical protein
MGVIISCVVCSEWVCLLPIWNHFKFNFVSILYHLCINLVTTSYQSWHKVSTKLMRSASTFHQVYQLGINFVTTLCQLCYYFTSFYINFVTTLHRYWYQVDTRLLQVVTTLYQLGINLVPTLYQLCVNLDAKMLQSCWNWIETELIQLV